MKMNPKVKQQLSTVEAVVKLLHPFVEAAVHDIESGKIIALYNNISRRKIGDESPLHLLKTPVEEYPDFFEPYYKDNWDGKKLKCTSITIRDDNCKPVGLICFNVDTSFFRETSQVLQAFLNVGPESDNPISLFEEDPRKQVSDFIDSYLYRENLEIHELNSSQRAELVKELEDNGFFNYRNATNIIADLLGLSRATIYNYRALE